MIKREINWEGFALEKLVELKETALTKTRKGDKSSKEAKLYAKILATAEIIENGEHVDSKIFQKMAGLKKSWEIRIRFANEAHRFYGTYQNGKLIVMRYYLSKKTEKTPKRIINQLKNDEKNI